MNITRSSLKADSKKILMTKIWPFFSLAFIPIIGYWAITLLGFGLLANIFFVMPYRAAYCNFLAVESENNESVDKSILWKNFKENYLYLVKNTFLRDLFLMLWEIPLAFGITVIFFAVYTFIGFEVIRGSDVANLLSEQDLNAFLQIFKETGVNIDVLKRELNNPEIYHELLKIFFAVSAVGIVTVLVGIVIYYYKVYVYFMTDFIIGEENKTNWRSAIGMSKEMMKGRKFFALKLDLSFTGWYMIVVVLSAFLSLFAGVFSYILMLIGFTIVSVYRDLSVAKLYTQLRTGEKGMYNVIDNDEI